MIGWAATWSVIASWEAWVLRRRAAGMVETMWTTTMSRSTRLLGRVHPAMRLSICLFTGGLLYHLFLEEEIRTWVPAPKQGA